MIKKSQTPHPKDERKAVPIGAAPAVDAIRFLDDQHKEVAALFAQAESASGKAAQKIFDDIADSLAIHAAIEEQIFYPACNVKAAKDLLLEAFEEHVSIKRVIADLLKLHGGDERFLPTLTVLKEQVEHHVNEERKEIFPQARQLFDKTELAALGQKLSALTSELKAEKNPRQKVPSQIEEAARI